jgi:hypothetical protein
LPTRNSFYKSCFVGDSVSDFEGGPCFFPAPKAKKEGFMSKLMDKLPGHHPKSPDATAFDAPTETGSPTTPKKGLVTKLKEKLPGHHDKSNDI